MTLAGKHYLAGLVWCVLLAIAYFIIDGQLQPKVATSSGKMTEIVISRSHDGHFYVAGQINEQAVTFLVDTGASTVAVSAAVAKRVGLPQGKQVVIGTAGGRVHGEEVGGQAISLGAIRVSDARIVILPNLPGEALLGQNVLSHVEVIQSADRMILRAKPVTR